MGLSKWIRRLLLYKIVFTCETILSSEGLIKNVRDGAWYKMYANGSDKDIIAVISLFDCWKAMGHISFDYF